MSSKNKKLGILGAVGGVTILVLAIIIGYLYVDSGKNSSEFSDTEAGKTFEAYYESVMGNDEKLEGLGITPNTKVVREALQTVNISENSPLYECLEKYYEDFSVKVISEEEYYDITDGMDKVNIVYEIDVYEYTKKFYEMTDGDNIGNYLTEEEIEIFKDYSGNYSSEEKEAVEEKFNNQYYEELENLEPVKKQYLMVMVKDDEGSYDFATESLSNANKKELESFLLSVIDMNPKPEL